MPRSTPRLLVLALLLCAAGHHVTWAADDPEIVFNTLYHVVFRGTMLSRFYRCLCDNNVRECTAEYRFRSSLGYIYGYEVQDIDDEDIPRSEDPQETYGSGSSFLCRPGSFATEDAITCTRLPRDTLGCEDQFDPQGSVCRSFHVETDDRRCDLGCVDVLWLGYFTAYVNFPSGSELRFGHCDGTSPITQVFTLGTPIPKVTTREPPVKPSIQPDGTTTEIMESSSSQSAGGGVSMKNDGGGGVDSVALGAGLGCAVILILIIAFIAGFIFLRRRRRRETSMNKPSLPYISHPHANTYSEPQLTGSGTAAHAHKPACARSDFGTNGSEYVAYLEPVSVYSQIADGDAASSTYANISDVNSYAKVSDDKQNGANAGGKMASPASIMVNKAAGQTLYDMAAVVEPPASEQERKQKKKKGGIEILGKKQGSKDGGKNEEEVSGYDRLHTGRSGKGQEVSRSFLARYNNPPVPPTAPPDEDSIYDEYGEEEPEQENGQSKPESSVPHIADAYSIAGPLSTEDSGVNAEVSAGQHHYVNTGNPSAKGVLNTAFTPDEKDSKHQYFELEANEHTLKGERAQGKPHEENPASVYTEAKEDDTPTEPDVYYELEGSNH